VPADPVEPLSRALALSPLLSASTPAASPPVPLAPSPPPLLLPDERALETLVRRFSWGGNGRRGAARIELGAGTLAGLTLLLSAEDGELSLEVQGDDGGEQGRRLAARLAAKGLRVTSVR
jgi:hypothetical protein